MTEIDVRCSVSLDPPTGREGRCQLFMGHDGPHAVMFSRGEQRLVRCWHHRDAADAEDRPVMDMQRPWMRGYPTPVWVEYPVARRRTPTTRR